MTIRENIRNILSPIINKEERNVYFDNKNTFIPFGTLSGGGTAEKLSAVYSAVNQISNSVATLPLNLHKLDNDGYKKRIMNHPTLVALNEPNRVMTSFDFYKMIVKSVMLNGDAFALIKRDKNGNAIEFRYIPFEEVTIFWDNRKYEVTYKYGGKDLKDYEILHFKIYSENGISGVSVITNAVNTIRQSSDSEEYTTNFFKSGALSGILTTEANVDSKQKKEAKEAFQNTVSKDGLAVLGSGFGYQSIKVNPKDAMLIETRAFNILEVARWFNISPIKLGDYTNNSYSTLEQIQLQYLQDTINPYLVMIEQQINKKIFLPSENKLMVEFNRKDMLSIDKVALASYYRELVNNGIINLNEARKDLGYNDIEHGDHNYMQLSFSTLQNIVDGSNLKNGMEMVKNGEDKKMNK